MDTLDRIIEAEESDRNSSPEAELARRWRLVGLRLARDIIANEKSPTTETENRGSRARENDDDGPILPSG